MVALQHSTLIHISQKLQSQKSYKGLSLEEMFTAAAESFQEWMDEEKEDFSLWFANQLDNGYAEAIETINNQCLSVFGLDIADMDRLHQIQNDYYGDKMDHWLDQAIEMTMYGSEPDWRNPFHPKWIDFVNELIEEL
jgi:hypothetical protein